MGEQCERSASAEVIQLTIPSNNNRLDYTIRVTEDSNTRIMNLLVCFMYLYFSEDETLMPMDLVRLDYISILLHTMIRCPDPGGKNTMEICQCGES
jgi:hypothetical protein